MSDPAIVRTMLITGTRKGIGHYLASYYLQQGYRVIGCSRKEASIEHDRYRHFCLDVSEEQDVKTLFREIRKSYAQLDILLNNAGIAAMNSAMLTPIEQVQRVLSTNVVGTFLFCREAAKLMKKHRNGRIVNFTTVAVPLKLEGEAIYASSKAAVVTLTEILGREFADFGITVNAIGPTPIDTDLTRAVPKEKIDKLIERQAIKRLGEFKDVSNVVNFFIHPESEFVTGQVLFLGGV